MTQHRSIPRPAWLRRWLAFAVVLCCGFFWPAASSLASGNDIVILQAARFPIYERIVASVINHLDLSPLPSGLKTIAPLQVRRFVLDEAKNPRSLRQDIEAMRPGVLIAVGTSSLELAATIADLPIVHLLVPYPEDLVKARTDITGIGLAASPATQLSLYRQALPVARRYGLLLGRDEHSDRLAAAATAAASEQGIELIIQRVELSREVPETLERLLPAIDALWLLPDRQVLTPQTLDVLLLASYEQRLPVLAFSEKYLAQGAALAVTPDFEAMARRGAELARLLVAAPWRLAREGKPPFVEEPPVRLEINQKVADKLQLRPATEDLPAARGNDGREP